MTVLDDVQRLMPPPAELRGPREPWDLAESVLEVRFPESFKSFIDVYGDGGIGNELGFWDPRIVFKYVDQIDFIQTHMREEQDTYGYPWPGFPAPGRTSWLQVATNGNGDLIGFIVDADGVASEDSVWVVNLRDGDFLELPGPFVELVHDLLTRSGRFHTIDEAFVAEESENSAWRLDPVWG